MILEFEDEKGRRDAQTRALMQTCSQACLLYTSPSPRDTR